MNYYLKVYDNGGNLVDVIIYQIPSDLSHDEFESIIDANWNHANSLRCFMQYMKDDGYKLAPQKSKKVPSFYK